MERIISTRNTGFTLAEVLITLGIIGVVAAMTIPTLMNNTNEKEMRTAWKKAYSVFSNATNQIKTENGGSMDGIFSDGNGMLSEYVKYVPPVKICSNSVAEGCIAAQNYKGLDGTGTGSTDGFDIPGVILKDGMSVLFKTYGSASASACSLALSGTSYPMNEQCGTIYIDVNGLKSPNIVGKDLFIIVIAKSGAYANGVPGTGLGIADWTKSCNIQNTSYAWRGQGCSAKYLLE